VIKSGNPNPQEASLLIVYTLAKALGISPLEQIKSEEMEKSMSDVKKTKW
jgi:hypothetical protein